MWFYSIINKERNRTQKLPMIINRLFFSITRLVCVERDSRHCGETWLNKLPCSPPWNKKIPSHLLGRRSMRSPGVGFSSRDTWGSVSMSCLLPLLQKTNQNNIKKKAVLSALRYWWRLTEVSKLIWSWWERRGTLSEWVFLLWPSGRENCWYKLSLSPPHPPSLRRSP